MKTRRSLLSGYSHVQSTVFAAEVSLLVVLTYALSWEWLGLQEFPVGIPGTVYLLGGLAALQLARWPWIDSWIRRGVTIGTLIGFVVAINGLGPTAYCVDVLPVVCYTSLNPDPLRLLAGLGMMTATLYRDFRTPVQAMLDLGGGVSADGIKPP